MTMTTTTSREPSPKTMPTPVPQRKGLRPPAGQLASRGLPRAESGAFIVVAPLLAVPLLIATMGALWVGVITLALTVLTGWLCRAHRLVIGPDWIAHRHLLSYHITDVASLDAAELVHNQHGGLLILHPHHGRSHRVRCPDLARPDLRAALAHVLGRSPIELGTDVSHALALSGPVPPLMPTR